MNSNTTIRLLFVFAIHMRQRIAVKWEAIKLVLGRETHSLSALSTRAHKFMTVKNWNCNRSKWKGVTKFPTRKRGLIVKQKLFFFLQRILTAETGTEKRRRKRRSGGRTSAKCTRTSVTVVERVENSSCATDPGVPRLTTWSASTSSNPLMVSSVFPDLPHRVS